MEMDSLASFEAVKAKVEYEVKTGGMTNEQARDIISSARESYRSNAYNKELERRKLSK